MNTIHNSSLQKDTVLMPMGFEIDDVLYSHVKFSKEQRRDILYTNEEDLEKQREVFKKGSLIAEYVGFQIQKD